jgi:GT2 family glycosyltransferase
MTRLSIVIPTFNTAAMTLRCCDAVLASMPEGTEVIVVDDGSTDDTASRIRMERSAVSLVRLEKNRGFANAANAGVDAAHGDLILLLNSDAFVETDALPAFLEAFARDPALGVAGAQLLNEDGSPQWSGGPTPTLLWMAGVVSGAGSLARLLRRGRTDRKRTVDWVSGAAMAFRRETWEVAGPLDDRFRFYCQDIEFCLRARDRGWRVDLIPAARVRHGLGKTIAGGNLLQHDPGRLWSDLVLWGSLHYGPVWSQFARLALFGIGMGRVVMRTIAHPFRRDGTTTSLLRATRQLLQSER